MFYSGEKTTSPSKKCFDMMSSTVLLQCISKHKRICTHTNIHPHIYIYFIYMHIPHT